MSDCTKDEAAEADAFVHEISTLIIQTAQWRKRKEMRCRREEKKRLRAEEKDRRHSNSENLESQDKRARMIGLRTILFT